MGPTWASNSPPLTPARREAVCALLRLLEPASLDRALDHGTIPAFPALIEPGTRAERTAASSASRRFPRSRRLAFGADLRLPAVRAVGESTVLS